MHAVDNETVAAEVALEPFGDTGDSGGTKSGQLLNLRVWDIGFEELGRFEAFAELSYLILGEQVAQKALCLVASVQR